MQAKTKTIMLLVTYKCNLHCSYCYEPKSSFFQMNAEKMKESIMRQVSCLGEDYEAFEVQFMGGEPLLVFPLIQEVSEWLWVQSFQKKMKTLFVPTNGTLLNEEMKDWLVKNKSRFSRASDDGPKSMQKLSMKQEQAFQTTISKAIRRSTNKATCFISICHTARTEWWKSRDWSAK